MSYICKFMPSEASKDFQENMEFEDLENIGQHQRESMMKSMGMIGNIPIKI